MTDRPDLDTLAQQYLDLWQDHVTALANDPSVARALSQVLALYGLGPPTGAGTQASSEPAADAQAMAAAWPAMMAAAMGAPGMTTPRHGARAGDGGAPSDGTAAAAAASGDRAEHVDELLRRVAALEDRLAALESERAGDRGAQRGASTDSGGDGDA